MMPLITVAKSQDGQIQPMESRNSKLSVKVEVGPDSLANLLGGQATQHLKYFVISIAGTQRCGKSCLANLLISYLTFLSKVS